MRDPDRANKDQQNTRKAWDDAAATFDEEPDHGLRDPVVLRAWTRAVAAWAPPATDHVLDIGCGTGALSLVLAGLDHRVTAVDFSREMVARAEAKAGTLLGRVQFAVMDAANPAFARESFDMIVCRHLLWALPDRRRVLERWVNLLNPGGRLLLIEGYWSTGGGVRAGQLVTELPSSFERVLSEDLSKRPDLWGKEVSDERYAIIADLA